MSPTTTNDNTYTITSGLPRSKRLREKAEAENVAKKVRHQTPTARAVPLVASVPTTIIGAATANTTTMLSTTAADNRKDATAGISSDGDELAHVKWDPNDPEERMCWKAHQHLNKYVELASNIMLFPISQLGPYGFHPSKQQLPLETVSALGYLQNPHRPISVMERWSPYEIAIFEAAIAHYGKEFHLIQRELALNSTKTTHDVIEFYYMWKKTPHYKRWKSSYIPPALDVSSSDGEDEQDRKDTMNNKRK